MSHTKVMLMMLLSACALLVSSAVAVPVSDAVPAASVGNAIQTTLQPDLTFKSTISTELLPTTAFHPKTCRCSCGFPCNQDDDCGPGGKCEQFISCCAKSTTNQSFQQFAARSTHQGEQPAMVVNVKCK